jgi:alkylation response protein AidB-like acyl-CoA dehydrogenase
MLWREGRSERTTFHFALLCLGANPPFSFVRAKPQSRQGSAMMQFHLSEEQRAIQEAVRGTLAEEWPIDRIHAFADGEAQFDHDSWQALVSLGVGGLLLDEKYGGSGLGLLDAALVCEIVGEAAAPGPFIDQIVTGLAISSCTNEVAKEDWLYGIATGERTASLAFHGLSGEWTVEDGSGEVPFVVSGGSADVYLVGTKGGGLALVEGVAADGVTVEPIKSTDRTRRLSKVSFERAQMQEIYAPGDPKVQRVIDAALILIAADALGGAQHCVDQAVAYAKDREQFGQPIGQFQGLKHQLAHMALDVEPARAMLWYAAYAHDADLPDAPRAAAMAKAHLCDVYTRTTRAAVAAHGGIGYTWEYGLNYWFRRSVFNRTWLGSPSEHRARAADMADW